ncbi:hypothetical protein [Altererythrobacter sp. MF3-039]|uniref:hypothetical protein n=1 Tax=Altererythrobacter sp. MF3-039 TaxID=3252901 RepID=UPI00390CBA99
MIRKILVVGACAAVAGCGQNYFVKGHALAPADRLDIVTAPAGALASNRHGNSCYTPCDLPLLTKGGGEVTIAKQGFHTERYMIGVQPSSKRIAMQATDLAVEATDPDPVTLPMTILAQMVGGKGAVQELDTSELRIELRELEEGEVDWLADDKPLTGERIPIDLDQPEAESKFAAAQ